MAMGNPHLPVGAGEPDQAMQQLSAHLESREARLQRISAAAAVWQHCDYWVHKHPQHLEFAAQQLLLMVQALVLLLLVD